MYKTFKIAMLLLIITGFDSVLAQQNNDSTPVQGADQTENIDHNDYFIITDRPDATESPNTVEPGFIQIETGGYYTRFEENEITFETLGYNTTLARIGLLENLELRLGVNYEDNRITSKMGTTETTADFESFTPMLAGIKINLFEGRSGTDFGFLGHIYLPFTTRTPDGVTPEPSTTGADFRFSVGHELSERSGIAYNLGGQWAGDDTGMAFVYTVAYGYALSDKIGAYVELYGDAPELSSANHYWDAGFTYLAGWNLQYDLTFGRSITEGQDLLLSAGLSYKFAY
jgi:hypothetical protein